MIRLAVHGAKDRWQAVSARLRGGGITGILDAPDSSLPYDSYDAVLLIAPGQRESALIESALAHGKHVSIVLPTELSPPALEKFAATAKQAGVQFAVINPDRYLPSRQLIRQQLDAQKLGRPGLVRMYRWESSPATSHAGTLQPLRSALLRDLDLAMWIVGRAPEVAFATEARRSTPGKTPGRTIQVHLGFPGGPMAMIAYSSSLPLGDDYRSLSVIGSSGAAYADDHQNMQLMYRGQHPQAIRADEGLRPLVNIAQDVVDALPAARDLSPSFADWQRAWTVAQAVEQSLESRQAIPLEGP